MSDESNAIEAEAGDDQRGISRRAALRAGVATGVGLAAWSGVSITSLGGTPAYAAGCTGAIPPIDLANGGGCRNIDNRSGCDFAYHDALKSGSIPVAGFPAGSFYVDPNIGEGVCCNDNNTAVFHFPSGVTCSVSLLFYDSQPGCANDTLGLHPTSFKTFGPESDGAITITFGCLPQSGPEPVNSWKYRVYANCSTSGVGDPSCFG
jgi:hypothetical protein